MTRWDVDRGIPGQPDDGVSPASTARVGGERRQKADRGKVRRRRGAGPLPGPRLMERA